MVGKLMDFNKKIMRFEAKPKKRRVQKNITFPIFLSLIRYKYCICQICGYYYNV